MTLSNSQAAIEARLAKIEEYGASQGAGDSALANAFLQCIIAAGVGEFDTIKRGPDGREDKKNGKDHAEMAYRRYVDAYSTKDVHKASTITKGASYFRTGVKAGAVKGLDGERLAQDISVVYSDGKKAGRDLRKPIEAFVAAANAQLKSQTQLTCAEILDAMTKPEAKEKETTALKLVQNAEKLLAKAHELNDAQEIALALEATQAALAFIVQGGSGAAQGIASETTGDVIDGEFSEVPVMGFLVAAE